MSVVLKKPVNPDPKYVHYCLNCGVWWTHPSCPYSGQLEKASGGISSTCDMCLGVEPSIREYFQASIIDGYWE